MSDPGSRGAGGRRIVEAEMGGQKRADYGDVLVERLAQDLTRSLAAGSAKAMCTRCGRSTWPTTTFSRRHLENWPIPTLG
jgi:hypothetical protein